MNKRIVVTITKRHIKDARVYLERGANRAKYCPIALALKDAAGADTATMGYGIAHCDGIRIKPSRAASRFVSTFDNKETTKSVKPSRFIFTRID